MFSLKLDFRNFASIRETSNGAKKANRSRNTLKVFGLYVLPIKSGWSTIIQYWSKEVMCIVSIVSFVPRTATFFQEARLFGSPSPKISIGWKMTFLKSKLIDNRPSWPALNFRGKCRNTMLLSPRPVLCRRSLNSPRKEDRQRTSLRSMAVLSPAQASRGRKSLSPSVRDNCRLCVKFGSQGIILKPRTCFSP